MLLADSDQARATGTLPLRGLKVLDIASYMAAPLSAMWLGDFGAEVIKVEHPKGDMIRTWGSAKNGVPLFAKMVNRNKQSVTIDLHGPKGQDLLRRLTAEADVLVENFRPGTLDDWNLSYASLAQANPRLVMLSITAFGQTGPYHERAGFGTLAEAMSGYAHVTGQTNGPPTLPSFALADSIAGLCGAMAVMVALHERQSSGLGQFIDLALYEPILLMLGHFFVDFDQLGIAAGRLGSRLPFAAPRNIFRSADSKWVAMSCAAQSVFERACRAIGRPELIGDDRYLTNQLRTLNADSLDAAFGQWIGARTCAEVLTTLNGAGAAAAPVYDIPDVFNDAHFQARENIATVADEELGEIRMQNVAPRLSRTPGRIRSAGPRLGAHTNSVLERWLGISPAELRQLHSDGVI